MSHQLKAVSTKKVIENGKQVTKNVVMPFHQVKKSLHFPTIETIPLNDWPNSTTLNANSRIRTQIPRGSFPNGNCSNVSLRFDVTMNGSSGSVTDIYHFWNKIECRAGGSGELLQTIYPDVALYHYLLAVNDSQFSQSADSMGFDRKVYLGGRSDAMSAGQTKTFYMYLVNSIFSADLEWDKIDQDIILEFYVASGSPVISGSGSVTCTCSLVIESREHKHTPDAKKALGRDVIHAHTFLDCVQIARYNQSLVASTQYLLPLDSVIGDSPYMLVNIVPAGTSDNSHFWSSTDPIGRQGLVNLLSPNNEGLLGNANIQAQILRDEYMTKNMKNKLLQDKPGFLVVPFSDSWAQALTGVKNGVFCFKQEKNNLMLQPYANKVNQVMTITVGNAAVLTSGNWRLKFGQEFTPYFNYNDTAATIKAGIEGLKIMSSNGITVTVSAALSSSATPTITFNSPSYIFQDGEVMIESNGFTGSAVPTSLSVTTTTQGVQGVSGSYDIVVYVPVYKTVYQNKNKLTATLDQY